MKEKMYARWVLRGQSMVEVVVALGAAVIILSSITFAVVTSASNTTFSGNQNKATQLAQEGLSVARSLRNADATTFFDIQGKFCLNGEGPLDFSADSDENTCLANRPNIENRYVRTLDFDQNNEDCGGSGVMKVESEVRWAGGKCTDSEVDRFCHNVKLTSCFADINKVEAPGAGIFTAGIPPDVSLTFNASSVSVPYNGQVRLTWTTLNATEGCVASNGWTGNKGSEGEQLITGLTSNRTFTLTCTGLGGAQDEESIQVTVGPPPPTIINFYAQQNPVPYGNATTLYWQTANTTGCSINWFGSVNTSGSRSTGSLTGNRTYSLTCTGPGGPVGPRDYTVSVSPPLFYASGAWNCSPQGGGSNEFQVCWLDPSGYLNGNQPVTLHYRIVKEGTVDIQYRETNCSGTWRTFNGSNQEAWECYLSLGSTSTSLYVRVDGKRPGQNATTKWAWISFTRQ